MIRSVVHAVAAVAIATLALGLAAPTADGEWRTDLPPCPSAPPPATAGPAPVGAPSGDDPAACRARPTRVEPAATAQLPVPEPGYHHLGGTTTEQWAGVLGRFGVRDTGVRAGSFDFVATRFLAKRGTDDGGTEWLEAGWADTGWSGDGAPRVYTFDSTGMSWVFYDQYRLNDGDRVWFYLHSEEGAWQAWLWWDARWHLLDAPGAALGDRARVEQYVEIHVDGDAGADGLQVPPVPVDGVHLQADPGAALHSWHDRVPTVVLPGADGYCLTWHRRYHDWSAGDCAD